MKQILFPFDEAYFSGFVCHEIWLLENKNENMKKNSLTTCDSIAKRFSGVGNVFAVAS
jgi:hypothetical protein